MSAGPMVHARERSALAESWPDPQPTVPTLRCCRQNSKNQLVHTSQVLLSHGARLVHRNLRGTRSSRCRATADSTRMTSGSRHAPHFSLGHHDSRPLLAALVSWKPRKTTSSTKPLNSLVHRPCRMSHRRLCILMRCNQGVEPCNALLHNAILSFLSVLSFLSHRVSHTDRITPRRTASHRSPRHTQTAANQTPWLGP
mgnify:CR=1 FL=1